MPSEPVQLTRHALFEQVWSEPIAGLATRYGISGVALAKACRKLAIPVPPRGYWARRQHGYEPQRPPLPAVPPGTREVVTFGDRPAPPDRQTSAPARSHEPSPPVEPIAVPDQLTDPHPLVRTAREALGRGRPDGSGVLQPRYGPGGVDRCPNVRVSATALPRALRILDALLKALEARAHRVTVAHGYRRQTTVTLFGETVAFSLHERFLRRPHRPTREETERARRLAAPVDAKKWDFQPTGRLHLRIDEYTSAPIRKLWSDGHQAQLETMLGDVVVGLALVAQVKAQDRQAREREAEMRRQAELQRFEQERQRQADEARGRELLREAERWALSQQLRAYLAAVERSLTTRPADDAAPADLRSWLDWARRYADGLDPLPARSRQRAHVP